MKYIIFLIFVVNITYSGVSAEKIISKNKKLVLGYHPGWSADSACKHYNWKALDILVYFGYEVDPKTGKSENIYRWNSTTVIDSAKANGVSTQLLVALMSGSKISELLSNPALCDTLIDDLINKVKFRQADGISMDFEMLPSSQRDNYITFLKNLRKSMDKRLGKESILSIAVPAVDWNNSWDFKQVSEIVDYIVMMGYDYYYSGSENAGPTAPLEGRYYNVSKSVQYLLAKGCDFDKLLLGVPWYGYQWQTESEEWGANTLSKGKAYTYNGIKKMIEKYGEEFDSHTKTKKLRYKEDDKYYQLWFDDSLTLSLKYDLVNKENLAGIGIWALPYSGANPELWNAILEKFKHTNSVESKENQIAYYVNQFSIQLQCPFEINYIAVYDESGKDISKDCRIDLSNKIVITDRRGYFFLVIEGALHNRHILKVLQL